jgi:SAM-dependent methyltransferase
VIKSYQNFVLNYSTLPWEQVDNPTYKDQHVFEIAYIRFKFVYDYLIKLNKKKKLKFLDVGCYPGQLYFMLKYIFNDSFEYSGVGLGLSDEYLSFFSKLNVKNYNIEIDPAFLKINNIDSSEKNGKNCEDWQIKKCDIVFLLDVFEHLVDPRYCLKQIHKSLNEDGLLIITTDNITNIRYIFNMLLSGASPNIPLKNSSYFYIGDWRPHFREYSFVELKNILSYCGFELIEHNYFDREQGQYYIEKGKVKKKFQIKNVRNFFSYFLVKFFNLFPHLRSHHFLVFKKSDKKLKNFEDLKTTDLNSWVKFRDDINFK